MSLRDFTKTYSTTEKASFWCNYMTALKGPLCVQDRPYKHKPVSVWTKVSSSDITLYDVLFGTEEPTVTVEKNLEQIPYNPVHTQIYGTGTSRTARIS
eukprot:TRINITY_DN14891_c0_g1_i1.p1 TRINITY_DN14891_c0_g1~~TRINITY_DN14891_c0_g1_i1.p1  ORF type:complete len:110 (-),score=15.74 TRINITY_DN14891_c0_g1_i1:68-361(-)